MVALFARVAPPLPVEGLFTYAIPEALAEKVSPGVRLSVPFGRRRLAAMCVEVTSEPPPDGVTAKPIESLIDPEPLAGADLLALAEWVAKRTGCTWGEALEATLPAAIKKARPSRTIRQVRLTLEEDKVHSTVEELQKKRKEQARTLRILADRGGLMSQRDLRRLARVSASPLKSLAKAGLVAFESVEVIHDPLQLTDVTPTDPHELTKDQAFARDRVLKAFRAKKAETFLLHGVTGSGKTEVYLQILSEVVGQGRQGIVLVPEISLTPQTVQRFRERFDRVAVLHSSLTDAERAHQWRRIRDGDADVVVGARSAVFAPVPHLGAVILDEEHETTFKQQNVPRYHARDVAEKRGRLAKAVVIMGTATPSLEMERRASTGDVVRLSLPERVAGGIAPSVQVVDLMLEERRKGYTFLSDALRAAMEDTLAKEGQVLLFLNRRGWASVLLCRTCRTSLRCPHCDVSMTMHRRIQRVLCHYCGHEEPPPSTCPACSSALSPLSFGTEKVEDEVKKSFAGVTVARMDSDTMTGRGSYETVLSAYGRGDTDVLIGTQMIAKGLDHANTLLVGVICADSALFLPDYRATERTFQLLAQVVGRTGRGPRGGRVVVQAYNPRHFSIVAGMAQDHASFSAQELPTREEAGFPPYGRLLRVITQSKDALAARNRLDKIVEHLTAPEALDGVEILGPATAPIPRINRQHRFHVVCKCTGPDQDAGMEELLGRLGGKAGKSGVVRVLVDVDPVALL